MKQKGQSRGQKGRRSLWIAGILCSILAGVAAGLGGFTFVYARGASYLSNEPHVCMNCHVMRQHFDAWNRSSHHAVAVCNDCHTPDGLVGRYMAKMSNGYHHSLAFTLGVFPEPLRIKKHNESVTEERCRSCHQAVVDSIDALGPPGKALSCIRCHREVGHPL